MSGSENPGQLELRLPAGSASAGSRRRRRAAKPRGDADERSRRRTIWSVVVVSLLVHAVALVGFGAWVVARKLRQPEAVFAMVPKKKTVIPVQTPEHRMNLARHEAMAPKPTFDRRVVSARPSEISLPPLPDVDLDQMLPLDPSELVADQVASLVGTAGLGRGVAAGMTGAGGERAGTGLSFFGIEDEAESVVVMIDVSASMFGRTGDYDYETRKKLREGRDQSFQVIRDEAIRLIDGLGINTRFNILHWSGSARLWQDRLVAASEANKAAAREHIQERIDVNRAPPTGGRPGGTRHDYALEALFELGADVAFMLTDGNATASKPGGGFEVIEDRVLYDLISEAKKKEDAVLPRIHTLYYLTGQDRREEERMLRGIARRTGGQFRKVTVKDRP